MRIIDNKTKRVFVLDSVYYDDIFKRTIYEFEAMGCRNWYQWGIPVYNNETLEEVLKKCDVTIDN